MALHRAGTFEVFYYWSVQILDKNLSIMDLFFSPEIHTIVNAQKYFDPLHTSLHNLMLPIPPAAEVTLYSH